MNSFDILVIGAGPAGLFAALSAEDYANAEDYAGAGQNKRDQGTPGPLRIGILEKNKSPGEKLLITGSGRCNLTHREELEEFLGHYGGSITNPQNSSKARFVKPALYAYPPERLEEFFAGRGVPLMCTGEGKVFPFSQKSRDILDVLLKECREKNISLIESAAVKEINPQNGGFEIIAPGRSFTARRVILAAGGRSFPQTGSDGDGERLAAALGHTVIPARPMAAPAEIRDFDLMTLAGVSLPAGMAIIRDGRREGEARGDLLFTHKGLSGPLIQNNCRYMIPGDILSINFAGQSPPELEDAVLASSRTNGKSLVKTFLRQFDLPESLAAELLSAAGLGRECRLADLDKKSRRALVERVCAFPFILERVGGWDTAKVTAGGVALKEVSSASLESRLVPGLYFAGEVLDVDGDTGGYNLQFAFSSGFSAGKNAVLSLFAGA